MQNPFFYGNPVLPDQLVDRRQELRRIAGRIANLMNENGLRR